MLTSRIVRAIAKEFFGPNRKLSANDVILAISQAPRYSTLLLALDLIENVMYNDSLKGINDPRLRQCVGILLTVIDDMDTNKKISG